MSDDEQVWSLDRVDQLERQVRDLIAAGDALRDQLLRLGFKGWVFMESWNRIAHGNDKPGTERFVSWRYADGQGGHGGTDG